MFIGTLRVELFLFACASLKEKRLIVKSLKDRLHNQFNVSVAETGHLDKWQRVELGIASVSNKKKHAEEMMQKVFAWIESEDRGEIIDHLIEVL